MFVSLGRVLYIWRMKKTSKTSSKESSKQSINIAGLAPQEALILHKLPGYFLILCLLVSFYFLFQILAPFLTVIFVAAVLVVAFYPLYSKILGWFNGWQRSASLVTCLLVILVTVAPITMFAILMTNEAVDTYEVVQEKINSGVFDKYLQWEEGGYFYDLKNEVSGIVDLDKMDIKKNVVEWAQTLSTFLVSQTGNFLKSISNMLMNVFILLFAMYYFFMDGKDLIAKVGKMSPLPSIYEGELFRKLAAMVKAILVGVFLTAIIQGVVGGIGFAIAGISSPIFWATAMAFFSLVPLFGTAVIWVPAAVILFILGDTWQGAFILIWGIVVVGSVDNFVRPYLIGGKAHTYPLLTFFVILGGIWTMGFKGIIIGPLVLMLITSFLHIYEAEYSKVLKK